MNPRGITEVVLLQGGSPVVLWLDPLAVPPAWVVCNSGAPTLVGWALSERKRAEDAEARDARRAEEDGDAFEYAVRVGRPPAGWKGAPCPLAWAELVGKGGCGYWTLAAAESARKDGDE